jgi:LEA14-like dessication related protein
MKIWASSLLFIILLISCATPKTFEYREIRNIKLDQFGFEKTSLGMEIVYFNPNNFGLDLRNVDADVYIDNHYLGKMLLDTSMHISKKSDFILPSKISLDLKEFYKNALNLAVSNEVLVTVKGTTRVGKAGIYRTVPFTYEGRHRLNLF